MWLDQYVFPKMTDLEYQLPVYMHATGYLSCQYPIDRPKGFPGFQWIQCTDGEGRLEIDGVEHTVSKDQGMFLYPDIPHKYYPRSDHWEVYWIILSGSQIETIAKLSGMTRSGVYNISNSDILLSHLKNAYSIACSAKSLVGLECAKLTYNLMLDITKCTADNELMNQDTTRLQPVIDYIEKYYAQVITLRDLADQLNITTQHLCMLFRQLLNMRPIEYLNRVRIHNSKLLMHRHRDKNISEIAYMVGFENPGYYARCFKQYEGLTPHKYRGIHGL